MASTGREASGTALRDRALVALVRAGTRLCDALGIDRSLALARAFGRAWAALQGPRTRRVREALAAAFPAASRADGRRWTREVFAHLASGFVELLLLRGRHREALLARVDVAGLEHATALGRGGALVVTAHLGNWELACAKIASRGFPLTVVYRGLRRPALDELLVDLRARGGCEPGGTVVEQIRMGPSAGVRVVRALEAGRFVIVLLDQNADREEGVFVPFFGREACTRSAPVALAMARGTPVLTAFVRRDAATGRHRLEVGPAALQERAEGGEAQGSEALTRNVARLTHAIEEAIRKDPAQWIWVHRRWRTRPVGGVEGAGG